MRTEGGDVADLGEEWSGRDEPPRAFHIDSVACARPGSASRVARRGHALLRGLGLPRHGARSLSELPPKTHKDTLDATPAGGRNRFVVMLTDGLMDTGSPTEDGAKTEELRRTAASLKSKGWPVYTIALSDQADGALMHEIAEATSRTLEGRRVGRYYLASTHDELLPTFKAIYLQMNPGQQALVEGGSFLIDPTVSEAIFVVTKSIRGAKVQVTQPDGSVFDRASAPGNYRWLGGGSYDIILIEEPKPGRWKVVAEDLSDLDISVQLVTDLTLEMAPIASTWPVGSGLPVFAYLAETESRVTSLESPLYAGLEMLVDAAPPGASPVTVALQDSGAAPDETAGPATLRLRPPRASTP